MLNEITVSPSWLARACRQGFRCWLRPLIPWQASGRICGVVEKLRCTRPAELCERNRTVQFAGRLHLLSTNWDQKEPRPIICGRWNWIGWEDHWAPLCAHPL